MRADALNPESAVREAMASSELIRVLERVRELGRSGVRLSPEQIRALEAGGSSSSDWSRIRVSPNFKPEFVKASRLEGDVYLGEFGSPVAVGQGLTLQGGVYNSTVIDSAVDDGSLVMNVRLLARAVVLAGAALLDVGELTGLPRSRFACGFALRLGSELGGREVPVYPEISADVAWKIARYRSDERMQSGYSQAVKAYAQAVTCELAVVSPKARVMHVPCARGVYLGPGALIDGASLLEECAILSTDGEPSEVSSGAIVRRSVVQWGSRVTSGAIVDESAVLERSSVGERARVRQSILGPCASVEMGEMASSLAGPLTAMHHQSLLIGTLWPAGKGNVAAGALVGSNHTSRAPDQEAFLGEGIFLGLGVAIKFPVDLLRAPYTVVAAGLRLEPQRLEFPFSLVREASPNLIERAAQFMPKDAQVPKHELIPAWVITENLYMLARAQRKFGQRCRSRRQPVDPDPMRLEVMEMVRLARDRLRVVESRELYTGRDIPGLGPNVMTEESRRAAIEGYTFLLVYKALLALWARARACGPKGDPLAACVPSEGQNSWEFYRSVLGEERKGASVRALLNELVEMQEVFVRRAESSKAKDDARGAQIIEGYAEAHTSASMDKVVTALREDLEVLRRDVEEFLSSLGA